MDASVVVLAFFVYQSGANSVISTLANIFISDLVVDFMLQGLKSGYKFEIITDKADDLSAELMAKLGRGVTTLHAEGMYTHTDKALLICIVRKRQVGAFLKILKNTPLLSPIPVTSTKYMGNLTTLRNAFFMKTQRTGLRRKKNNMKRSAPNGTPLLF